MDISIKSYKITAGAFFSIYKTYAGLYIVHFNIDGFRNISINNFQTLDNLIIYAFIKVSIY